MPSPFPGMDPYLEASWGDVHSSLVIYARDALQKVLPSSLRARVERRVVQRTDEEISILIPDVQVVERREDPYRSSEPGATAVAEPLILDVEIEPLHEKYIEIRDVSSGNKVVTHVEFLSPTNKIPGESRDKYQTKQRDVCKSDVNLVEVDLVRTGKHVAAVPLVLIPPERRTPYLVCVRRATARSKAEVYPVPLDRPLPAIKIPLRPTDPDVVLALQPLIEQCYAGYEGDVDYNQTPVPPLTGPDAEWADALLREKGLRTSPPPGGKPKRKKPPKRRDG
jgi:hypothetical protein